MKRVAVFETPGANSERLEQVYRDILGDNVQVDFFAEPLDECTAEILAQSGSIDALCVFVGSRVNAAVLGALKRPDGKPLHVVTRSRGTNHINSQWVHDHGGQVARVGSYPVKPIVDQVAWFLAAPGLQIKERNAALRAFSAYGEVDVPNMAESLQGKLVGIHGCGSIGRAIANRMINDGHSKENILAFHPRRDIDGLTTCQDFQIFFESIRCSCYCLPSNRRNQRGVSSSYS